MHVAIERGINYFDVAPYYGRTLAEERLGAALAGRRERVILATKCGRYDRDLPDGFDYSAKRVTRSVDESLRRLRTDWIDVIQVHDIEFGVMSQIVEETLPALERLRERGKIRFVGITGYGLRMLAAVARAARVDTVLSYCRYNLMDTSLERELLPLARQCKIGLINASPLHMRLLTRQGAPAWHPAPARVHEAAAQAAAYLAERGVDIADLAMQFALAQEGVATTLVGMSKVSHVERNVALVGVAPDAEMLAAVRVRIAPAADVAWRSGRPENDDPGAVEPRRPERT